MDSETRKSLEALRSFKRGRVLLLAAPFIGIADLANVAQRFPNMGRLYGIETVLMALDGLSAVVALAALLTKRSWRYTAYIAWVLFGVIRLLGVGHLQ